MVMGALLTKSNSNQEGNTMMNEYINSKKEEIILLSSFLNDIPDEAALFSGDLISVKREIRAKLISEFIFDNPDIVNTNRNFCEYEDSPFEYIYGYQRFDMKINCNSFFQNLYFISNDICQAFFTNSGMSAIYSFLSSISMIDGVSVTILGDTYVETQKIIDKYKLSYSQNSNFQILYLDTSNNSSLFHILDNTDLSNYHIVAIDTTCYDYDDLFRFSKYYSSSSLFVLLRSHMKLDMLGTEYAKLGSIVYFKKNDTNPWEKNLITENKEILSLIGGFAYPEDIPVFWKNKKSFELNAKRVRQIKSNTFIMHQLLLEELTCKVILPYHQLFLLIDCAENDSFRSLQQKLFDFAHKNEDITYSGSFALDYFSIDAYMGEKEKLYIRVSPNDSFKEDVLNKTTRLVNYIRGFYEG